MPIIVSGGFGKRDHIKKLISKVEPSGIAVASGLHYKKFDVTSIKEILNSSLNEKST